MSNFKKKEKQITLNDRYNNFRKHFSSNHHNKIYIKIFAFRPQGPIFYSQQKFHSF